MASPDSRAFLRHTLATLAYRAGKTMRGAPDSFAEFRAAPSARTPVQIVAHMGDLFDWALSLCRGAQAWHSSTPLPWDQEVARFFDRLEQVDRFLAGDEAIAIPAERLFQGPIADALTHTGQIAVLRRLAGCPIRGENYLKAQITVGRVGADQPAAVFEFD
jgi:hypothetical protein